MRLPRRFFRCLVPGLLLLITACSQAAVSGPNLPPAGQSSGTTKAAPANVQQPDCPDSSLTPQPCLVSSPAVAPPASSRLNATQEAGPSIPGPAEATPTTPPQALAATDPPPLLECLEDLCVISLEQWLLRPVAPPGRDEIDTTYRFGTTQEGQRDPHHGVEFLNSFGTPVLAAADGVVEVAGDDRTTFYGPYSYFYGNLVVIRHELPGIEQAVFTLYGHLSQLGVKTGDRVRAGQEIGRVGMSGVATGSHLHFEVRLDGNTYASSRNPELWLSPHNAQDGIQNGALAGRILDPQGNAIAVSNIVLEHLPAPDQAADRYFYLGSYEEKSLAGQSPWKENFAIGDLPAGWYRLSFVQNGFQRHLIQVFPGQLTVVTFRPGG